MKKLLFIPSLALLSLTACNMNRVKGNGHVVSKDFSEKGFKDIDVESALTVYLKQGPDYSVRIDAEDNILELMQVRVAGDELKIGYKDNINAHPTKDVKVYITAPDFRNLEASGACNIISRGSLRGNAITLSLSGASNSELEVETNKLEVDASGASEINLKGKTAYLSVDGSGSTEIHGFPLLSEHTKVSISGSGEAEVYASQSLEVEISGAGDIKYKGNPATVNKDVSGAGSITQVN